MKTKTTSPATAAAHVAKSGQFKSKRRPGDRLLPDGSAGAVSHWWEVQWPRVGGVDLLPLPQDAFADEPFLQGYRPGTLVYVYCAGCGEDHRMPTIATGLLGVARRLFAGIHKVSVTAQVKLTDRLRELNKDRYGSVTVSADGYDCSDRGFDNWMFQQILPEGKPLPGSPVAADGRCLPVRLPFGLSKDEFEERLHQRMHDASLNAWLQTKEASAHCAQIGRTPAEFRRRTAYRFGDSVRWSEAKEFYFFRPKSDDADRLIRIAEVIIHEWVTDPITRLQLVSYKSLGQGYVEALPRI
uniref:Uncharacterized protein n=1 Tax=Bosea sp. NBC_00436 TaxID=2969620 RepID=A0A9E7ZVV2_9HYPH